MSDLLKVSEKGVFAKRNWADIQRSGGIAPDPDTIMKYLEGDKMAQLTREEVFDRVGGYILGCIEKYVDEDSGQEAYRWRKNPTKSGLARAVGVTLETLCRYVKGEYNGSLYNADCPGNRNIVSPNDFDIIRSAYGLISEFYEGQLAYNKNNSGVIFWLLNRNNERWSNTQDLNISTMTNDTHLTREEVFARYQAFKSKPEKPDLD